MSAKPTPGPWRVFPGDPECVYSQDGKVLILQAGQAESCLCDETPPSHGEACANACLSAAAPDMLIQLKGLLGFARFVINAADIDPELTTVVLRANGEPVAEVPIALILDHSEAAIAKAEGRS